MGGGQSCDVKTEETEDQTENHQESNSTDALGMEDAPTELPQCRMGNKQVDNMCFMISCTNWY